MTTCPKCGYERKAGDEAPDWQCPSCGVAYAKVLARMAAAPPARPEEAEPVPVIHAAPDPGRARGSALRLGVIAAAIGVAAYTALKPKPPRAPPPAEPPVAAMPQVTQTITVNAGTELLPVGAAPFSAVDVNCHSRIALDSGANPSAVAQGDGGALQVQITGGTLFVACGGATVPELHLVTPALSLVYVHSNTNLTLNNLAGDSLEIHNEGAGTISANGHVDKLILRTGGAGTVDLGKLAADEAEVSANGAGWVTVNATRSLKANLSGGRLIDRTDDGDSIEVQGGRSFSASGHVRTLNVATSGSLSLRQLTADEATVSLSGSTSSEINVNGSLDVTLIGTGELDAWGTASTLKAHVETGRGIFDQLQADDAVVYLRGAGTITTNVSHSLDATVDGAGHVTYRGSPAIVTPHIKGSGTVTGS